jgi:protoporphyrin/coproporphyrin ferrochelatase
MFLEKVLIVNFGGPRNLAEISPFLCALLTDRDVIRTSWPDCLHHLFFTYVARRRAKKIVGDYELIGGKSPIFEDTEAIASLIGERLGVPVETFHRYLTATHRDFIKRMEESPSALIHLFPLFPQFSYATTGSSARWFSKHLSKGLVERMRWIRSYPHHSAYIRSMQRSINDFFKCREVREEEVILLFSAHGLPQSFIETGDPYQKECESSFQALAELFPRALSRLCYQSKFGRGEWLRPSTEELCQTLSSWSEGRGHVCLVPLSFTSDHVETLFEIEYQYLPLIRAQGSQAYRLPALNRRSDWMESIVEMISSERSYLVPNGDLFR